MGRKSDSKKSAEVKSGLSFAKIFGEIGVGALGGFLNGFFGGGGGMVIVPMLIKLLKYERKAAHASCIAVILPVALTSGLIYAFSGEVDFVVLPAVAAGVLIGGVIGAVLLKKIKSKWLGYIFCGIMALAGIKMIF